MQRRFNPSKGVHRQELKQPRAASVPPEEAFQEVDKLHSIAARRLVRLVRPHTSLGNERGEQGGHDDSAALSFDDDEQQWQDRTGVGRYGAARAAAVEHKVTKLEKPVSVRTLCSLLTPY